MKKNGLTILLIVLILAGYFKMTAESNMELTKNDDHKIHIIPMAP